MRRLLARRVRYGPLRRWKPRAALPAEVVAFVETLLDDWELEVDLVAQDRCVGSEYDDAIREIRQRREEWARLRGVAGSGP